MHHSSFARSSAVREEEQTDYVPPPYSYGIVEIEREGPSEDSCA